MVIQRAQAIQNPVAYLQSQAANIPIVKEALELGKEYNGNYDAATAAILKENNIDINEAKSYLKQLGII